MTGISMTRTRFWRFAGLFLVSIVAAWSVCCVSAYTIASDVSALKALEKAWPVISDLKTWNGNDPCGLAWDGVTCDTNQSNSTVINLSLDGWGLRGTIPPEIGNLSNLVTIELSNNPDLVGSLPKDLQNLKMLEILSIQFCGLTGTLFEELGTLTSLNFLALTGNNIVGTIPASIGYLSKLVWFDLSENQMDGPLPVSATSDNNVGLDNLTSINHLHLNNNSFSGDIPGEIFSLPMIIHVLLDHNNFTGSIPPQIENSQSILILRLDYNQMKGPITPSLNSSVNITDLNLANNQLTGTLPDLSGLRSLSFLDVSFNTFDQQPIPDWISSTSTLLTLNLESANFSGEIPSEIFNLPYIETIDLSHNAVNGTLVFSDMTSFSLESVDLENNSITGLTGQPSNNGHVTNTSVLLGGNPLCSYAFLDLENSVLCNYYSVSQRYTASLNSSCATTCGSGESLNSMTCNCSYPLELDMDLVSPSFSALTDAVIRSIEVQFYKYYDLDERQVVIHNARFTDNARVDMTVYVFPLTGDCLDKTTQNNIVHDLRLHGLHLKEGPFLLYSFSTSKEEDGKTHLSNAAIISIAVAAVLAALLITVSIWCAVRQKRRADDAIHSNPFVNWGRGSTKFGPAPQLKGARWFTLAEIKAATKNFSEENELGEGGYGKVYKATFPNGDVRAVKRARADSLQGAVEFKNEIELLSRVHHRNLVGLVGFCYEQEEQLLIYEFMTNGTLRDHLTGRDVLSWQRRLDIALGSARGLAYLHDHASPPIIHRDVKSQNILLNDTLVAKVSDFGLSKLAPEDGEKTVYSVQVKGTLGYLDPEYYSSNQLTDKSDVYSFGVVLLEMLSSRPPIEHGKFIVREMRTALDRGGVAAVKPLLDPDLKDYPPQDFFTLLQLALRCTEDAGDNRPTMNEIVKELEVIGAHSYPNSGVNLKPARTKEGNELYKGHSYANSSDQPFLYSGAVQLSRLVEPK